MIKPELDTTIMGEWDPQLLMKKIRDFKKDNIVDYSQYAPVAVDDKIFFSIALFHRLRPTEGILEDIPFIPKEEKPGTNDGPIWMNCPKCKKPCLPYEYDTCRCGYEFTKEDRNLFKELLAADGGQRKVKKNGKTKVGSV